MGGKIRMDGADSGRRRFQAAATPFRAKMVQHLEFRYSHQEVAQRCALIGTVAVQDAAAAAEQDVPDLPGDLVHPMRVDAVGSEKEPDGLLQSRVKPLEEFLPCFVISRQAAIDEFPVSRPVARGVPIGMQASRVAFLETGLRLLLS